MTKFFIPGVTDHARSAEHSYAEMRKQIELRMGHAPRDRRILELVSRRGSVDCVTKVGTPDPICGDVVIAIFDMGSHQPFLVWCQSGNGTPHGSCEVLASHAYSVLEFER
jgi:hypothetical protein